MGRELGPLVFVLNNVYACALMLSFSYVLIMFSVAWLNMCPNDEVLMQTDSSEIESTRNVSRVTRGDVQFSCDNGLFARENAFKYAFLMWKVVCGGVGGWQRAIIATRYILLRFFLLGIASKWCLLSRVVDP